MPKDIKDYLILLFCIAVATVFVATVPTVDPVAEEKPKQRVIVST